ncbi:MAG: serine/threonine-protein kinase [Polyangiaceae bacterium]
MCPKCAQHFSPDGRFCPFDGEPLQAAPEWDPSSDPLLGTIVDGRYDIRSVLGEGGMGVVYEVRHRALGKRFALKALRKELATDADIAARFMQEARTAASVSHPGLVEITDFGRLSTGQPFFVMELLEGQSLASLIRRGGPMPAGRAVDIVRQIADALGAAHERSIVHRDLKPDNIHVTPEGVDQDRVTIVDFGLAKVIGTSRLTRAGMVFGTPHYMSPEQAMGEAIDHRADVYALGIVMYEMLTGRVPFEADSYMGVLTKHMYMAPTPPSQLLATAELGVLEDITLRCLEKKPDHRYATLRELTHDLLALSLPNGERPSASRPRRAISRSLLADELELPGREERPSGAPHSARKRRLGWPLIVLGGLFLAGIAGVLALRKSVTPSAKMPGVSRSAAARAAIGAQNVTAPLPTGAAPKQSQPAETEAEASAASQVQAPPKPTPKRGKVGWAAPIATAATAAPAPKSPVRTDSSDIVDPWAK